MHKFSPAFSVIEARLRSNKDMEQSDALASFEITCQATPLSMPAFINHEIERTVAAQAIKDISVESGAIVLVRSLYGDDGQIIEQLRSPIAFCLDAKKVTRGDISEWTGWMVSPDCDYATEKDVLLEPGDGPFDPSAGMVQTWNRLTLRIPSRPRVLAKLSDYRLSILREVETEGNTDIPPRPGHIASRVTSTKRTALTGSPLRSQNDLRNDYRQLYSDRAQEIAVKQAVVRDTTADSQRPVAKTGGMMAWLMGRRLQMAGFSATLAGVMIAAHVLLKEPEAPGPSPVQIARVDTPTVTVPPAPPVSPAQEAPVEATAPTHPPRAEKSAVSKPNLGKTVAPTQMAKAEPPVIAEPGTTESGAQKEGRRPTPVAAPILLASLDEAQFAIPMVRSVRKNVPEQTSPDSTPVLLEAPTHVLRVVGHRKSVSLAIARLAAMGIQAIPASSPVPAVVFSLPKGMPVAEIEAKLAGDELFLPRSVWLRPKGE